MLPLSIADPGRPARLLTGIARLAEEGVVHRGIGRSAIKSLNHAARQWGATAALLEPSGTEAARDAARLLREASTAATGIAADLPKLERPGWMFLLNRRTDLSSVAGRISDAAATAFQAEQRLGTVATSELESLAHAARNAADDAERALAMPIPVASATDAWVAKDLTRAQGIVESVDRTLGSAFFVHGAENLPEGGAILAAPHGSNFDGFALARALPDGRQVRAVASDQLLGLPGLGKVVGALGAFPVERGKGAEAMGRAAAMAKQGQLAAVFSEGRMVFAPGRGEPYQGAFEAAVAAGTPFVPVGTAGVKPGFSLGELRVYRQPRVAVIGEAIMPPSGAITPAKLDAFMEAGWRSVDAASAKAEQLRAAMPHDLRAKHAILPALAAGTVVSTAHQVTDDE